MGGMSRVWRECVVAALAIFSPLSAQSALIGFEEFADGTALTNQIAGLTFTNATVLQAGITLNEFDFPPGGGTNVIVDEGGPMSIVFGTSVSTFSAFFTYVSQVTLLAYDDADVLVDTATSLFGANFVSAGTVGASPNELLQLDFAGGMRRIELIGDPGGLSFVLDDASFEPVSPGRVPEPSSVLLAATALGLATGARCRSRLHV